MRARESDRVIPFGLAYGLAVVPDRSTSTWLRVFLNASVSPWAWRFIAELGMRSVPRLAPASPKESWRNARVEPMGASECVRGEQEERGGTTAHPPGCH